MEKTCRKCGRTLPIENFKTTRYGTWASVCNDCVKAQIKETKERREKIINEQLEKAKCERRELRIHDFTPRELMAELYRRGYEGKLTYTEVHEIDITKINE